MWKTSGTLISDQLHEDQAFPNFCGKTTGYESREHVWQDGAVWPAWVDQKVQKNVHHVHCWFVLTYGSGNKENKITLHCTSDLHYIYFEKKIQSEEHPNPTQGWREYFYRHDERVTINRASDDERDGEQDMEDARKKRAKVEAVHEGKSRDNIQTIREQALEEAQSEPDCDQHIFDTVYLTIVSSEEEASFHVK